jgi:zinc protease
MFPPGHPYAHPVSGTQESVASLTLDKARQFVARTYDPTRMTLYVAAPSSLDAFKRVSDAFAEHAGGPLASVAATTQDTLSNSLPASSVGPLLVHEAALPVPELWLSWPLPASTLQDRARAELLANLTDALVRPTFTSHPAVAHAGCELNEEALSAVLTCRLILNDATDAEGVLNRTLTDLRNGFGHARMNHDWVWTRQRDLALDSTFELEGLQARTVQGVQAARVYGSPFLHQEVLGKLPQLDLGDVSSLGYAIAERGRTFALLMKPQLGATVAASPAAQEAGSQSADDMHGVAPDIQQTLSLVKPQSKRELSQFQLSNGLTVIAQRRRGTSFVSAILGFRGGHGWANDPAIGVAAALAETWHVESAPSLAGLSLRWDDGEDDRRFVARAVAPDLKTVLDALSLERNPHLEWPSLRFRRMLPALTSAENSFDRIAARKERSALFGNHPYAAYVPAARADAVTGQALLRFFNAVRRPDNAVLVLVSDTDPEEVQSAVQAAFGKWQKPSGTPVAPPPAIDLGATRAPSSVIVVNKAGSQVELRFACLLEQGIGEERVAEATLADALGRQAHTTLRDETGIAYYASANFRSLAAGVDEISVQTTVDKRHVAQALSLFKSLSHLQAPPISEPSLAWLRFQGLQAVAFRDETSKQTADSLYRLWLEHVDLNELEQWPTRIANISMSDLLTPLRSCTRHSVIVAVGDQATIEQANKN